MKSRRMFSALDRMTSGMQKTNRRTVRFRNSLDEVKKQIDRICAKKEKSKTKDSRI